MRPIRSGLAFFVVLISFFGAAYTRAAQQPLPPLTTLSPGASVRITQNLDVNVVLIGFEEGTGPQQIDTARFRSLLPPLSGSYLDGNSIVGYPVFGLEPHGLSFNLHYNIVHTPAAFNDAFFGFLRAIAVQQNFSPFGPGAPQLPVIPSQFLYDFCNVSPSVDPAYGCSFAAVPRMNTRIITQNYFIDARLVEQVLGDALPLFGVDTSRHTVVLINWWGRGDFVDHVYFKLNDVDVDTGVSGGVYFRNMMSGWGGTAGNDPDDCPSGCPTRRLMYLDVSAGPIDRLGNWDIASPNVRIQADNGIPDDRLPPIWEYGNTGFRAFNDLTADLAAKFVGDVFVQTVATPTPLYPPSLSPPRQPQQIQVDINLFDAVPGSNTSSLLNPSALVTRLSVLPYTFSTEFTRTAGMPQRLDDVLSCFRTGYAVPYSGDACYGQRIFGAAGADLYAYFRDQAFRYLEGDQQYEVPTFMFHIPDAQAIDLGGLADENWADQVRQSFVYSFSSPRNFGPEFMQLGKTSVLAHEVGHHLGLTHPHDGFICADASCIEPKYVIASDSTFYSWLGDQQSSLMSYNRSNDDFGQFDLDNMDRNLTYTYLSLANVALAKLATSTKANSVTGAISAADADAAAAVAAYQAMQYRTAATSARSCFERLLAAIDELRIPFDATNWHGDFRTPSDVRDEWRRFLREANQDRFEPQVDFLKAAGIELQTSQMRTK